MKRKQRNVDVRKLLNTDMDTVEAIQKRLLYSGDVVCINNERNPHVVLRVKEDQTEGKMEKKTTGQCSIDTTVSTWLSNYRQLKDKDLIMIEVSASLLYTI